MREKRKEDKDFSDGTFAWGKGWVEESMFGSGTGPHSSRMADIFLRNKQQKLKSKLRKHHKAKHEQRRLRTDETLVTFLFILLFMGG